MIPRWFSLLLIVVASSTFVFAADHDPYNNRTPALNFATDQHDRPYDPPRTMDTLLYRQDFTQPAGWTFEDASDLAPQWHPDTVQGVPGDSAWWCGSNLFRGYGNYWYQVVQTPILNLSGTTTPSIAFKLAWSVENAGTVGAYNGFDGVTLWISTNGGRTFTPVSGVTPAYTCTALYAAGSSVWNIGNNIPGYAGSSGGYRVVSAPLTNFRSDSVVVRWSVISDRGISSETRDTMRGAYLDSIRLTDGANLIFTDDGARRGPNTLQTVRTFGFGTRWEFSSTSYVSPTMAAHCDDDFPNQQSCLVTPPITLPMSSTYMRFQVKCDMPDSTHTGSNFLRDFYQVDVQGPDSLWHWITSDYARGGRGYPNWYAYGPGSGYSGDTTLSLSTWAGQTVRIRFKAITDYDNAPSGTGLWIDDFEIWGTDAVLFDAAPIELRIPFPTTIGRALVPDPFVRLQNLGRGTLTNVAWSLKLDGGFVPQTPVASMAGGEIVQIPITVPLTTPGGFRPAIRMTLPTTPPRIVTQWFDPVVIMTENIYELGYDSRNFWLRDTLPDSLIYATRFTPTTDGFSGGYHVGAARFATYPGESGTLRLKLMSNTGTRPAVALIDTLITVTANTDTFPQWRTIDFSNRVDAQNRTGFVWLTIQREPGFNYPRLAADTSTTYSLSHTYRWLGGTATPAALGHDVAMRMVIIWPSTAAPEPVGSLLPRELSIASAPNPFNSTTGFTVDLPNSESIKLAIYDLQGRVVQEIFSGALSAGTYRFHWQPGNTASGVYFARVSTSAKSVSTKLTYIK